MEQILTTSVVIPTYNRKKLLKTTLLALSKQNYPKDRYEIIVVDDGNDRTDKMIKKLKISNLRYFRIKNLGYKCVSRARNIGIKQAKNEIIIFVDSDIVVTPNFILEHIKNHIGNKNLVVIGYTSGLAIKEKHDNKKIIKLVEEDYNKIINIPIIPDYREWIYTEYSDDINNFFAPWETFITSNLSFRKQHLIDVGMFDENFRGWGVEDIELGYRLFKKGLTFKLDRSALGYHIGTDSVLNPYLDPSPEKWESYIKNLNYFFQKFNNLDVKKTLVIHNIGIPNKLKLEIFKSEPKKHLLKIDSICNNDCSICNMLNKKGGKKGLNEIKEILGTMPYRDELTISGGEPTLREDIFEIIGYAKRRGFKKIILETNGRIFSYKDFCQRIIRAGIDRFDIYLYSHNPKIHDKITRVKGSWNQTIDGIKNLLNMKQKIQINIPICRENYKKIYKTVEFLKHLKVDRLYFIFLDNIALKKTIPYIAKTVRYALSNHIIIKFNKYNLPISITSKTPVIGPNLIQFHISDICNNGCIFCKTFSPYLNGKNSLPIKPFLDLDFFKKYVDEAKRIGAKEIELTGRGEPFLNPQIMKMIRYAKEKELFLRILTSFTLVNQDLIKKILEDNVDELFINLPAATAETYMRMRPNQNKRTFYEIKKNLNFLNNMKQNSNKPRIRFIFIVCAENYMEILKYIELAKKLGANFVEFKIIETIDSTKKLQLTNNQFDEFKKIITNAIYLAEKNQVETNLGSLEKLLNNSEKIDQFTKRNYEVMGCYIGWTTVSLEMDRVASPCCICPDIVKIENQTLDQIWWSKEFEIFRNKGIDKKWRKSHKLCEIGCFNCPLYSVHADIYNELKEHDIADFR